jgi:hypothetical protein
MVHLETDATPVLTEDVREIAADADDASLQSLAADAKRRRTRVVARLPAETEVEIGEDAFVQLDAAKLHFFDLETGLRLARARERAELPSTIAAGGSP